SLRRSLFCSTSFRMVPHHSQPVTDSRTAHGGCCDNTGAWSSLAWQSRARLYVTPSALLGTDHLASHLTLRGPFGSRDLPQFSRQASTDIVPIVGGHHSHALLL